GNGNGGVANLSAGRDLLVNGSILAVGSGQGDGGSVALVSGGGNQFMVGQLGLSSVVGGVDVSAGAVGRGGNILITNNGSGILIENLSNLVLNATRGAGGTLSISAPNGTIFIDGGNVSASAAGGVGSDEFDGGSISVSAPVIATQTNTFMNFRANGSGSGSGGSVSFV